MASFLSVLSTVAKANKFFTIVNLGFDTAMMGVQIAEAVDPGSVCVAWDVKGLAIKASEKGVYYDNLLDQLAQISTDLDNISQAVSDLKTLADYTANTWVLIQDLELKLQSAILTLDTEVPMAHKWLGDLEKLSSHPPSTDQLNELKESLKIPDWQIGVGSAAYGLTIIGFVGGKLYAHYRANQPRPRANAFDANDPQWRRKQIASAVLESAANFGSFGMNIWQVVQLVERCQEQANKLNNDIKTYETNTVPIEALINGCKKDPSKLDAVQTYLKTIDSSQSYSDPDSEKLLNEGLRSAIDDYNHDLEQWLKELDEAFYKPIQDSIHKAVEIKVPGIDPDLDQKLSSGYAEFQAQKSIVNDKTKKSPDRLIASREIIRIFHQTVSSTANQIVLNYQTSVGGVQVESFLMTKAKFIAGHPRKLDQFKENKTHYVTDEGIMEELDNQYPDRNVLKRDDSNAIDDVANYLDKCLQSIPHKS